MPKVTVNRQPPIKSVTVELTIEEAQVLAYVAEAVGGPIKDPLKPSDPESKIVYITQYDFSDTKWNPKKICVERVRDVLRAIGGAVDREGVYKNP